MATQFSMLGIMNAALISQGMYEIASDNDGSDEFRLLSRNWPGIVESELENGKYIFSKQQSQVQSRIDGLYGYSDGYLVPPASLHVRNLWLQDTYGTRYEADWVQDSTHVYTNNATLYDVYLEVMTSPDESLWSATFCRGVQLKLEALILRAAKEEAGEALKIEQQAELYFQRARGLSSLSRSAQPVYRSGPIANARKGRG